MVGDILKYNIFFLVLIYSLSPFKSPCNKLHSVSPEFVSQQTLDWDIFSSAFWYH